MAKIKQVTVEKTDFTPEGYAISAKGANTINIDDATLAWAEAADYRISNGKLEIESSDGNKLIVSDYKGIKYIKTDSQKIGKKETYNLVDLIGESRIDNLDNGYTLKNRTANGTNYNDKIDLSTYGKGLTIKGIYGNDTIIGSAYNDKIYGGNGNDFIAGGAGNDRIKGGAGANTVTHAIGDGDDTVYLTKGENLILNFASVSSVDDLEFTFINRNKDLKISYGNDALGESGSVTLKNFAAYDVTGASGSVNLQIGNSIDLIDLKDAIIYDGSGDEDEYLYGYDVKNSNYTGTWLNEFIDAEEASKKVVLKGRGGNDVILGSKYNDTIYGGEGNDAIDGNEGDDKLFGGNGNDLIAGGAGNDTIKGGNGDDVISGGEGNDKLYGERGVNSFIFEAGDGHDTIYSGKGEDTLVFKDYEFKDLSFERGTGKNNKDLIIKYNVQTVDESETFDSVTLKNYYTVNKKGDITGINSSVKYINVTSGTLELESAMKEYKMYSAVYPNEEIIIGSGEFAGTKTTDVIVGGLSDDTITTGRAHDVFAREGDDTVYISNSDKTVDLKVYLGEGDDTIETKDSGYALNALYVDGNNGNDKIDVSNASVASNAILIGGAGNDTILGSDYGNIIYGDYTLADDPEQVLGDADTIYGGTGADTIYGGAGADEIYGGAGNDYLSGDDGNDTISGGDGADTIYGGAGVDKIFGGAGNDSIYGDAGDDYLLGDDGNDAISGGDGTDKIYGGVGADSIYGGAGNDSIYGDEGDDYLSGDDGNDSIFGGDGADKIYGGAGADSIYGGAGNDSVYGGDDADTIYGGTGADSIYGGAGDDVIYGNDINAKDTTVGTVDYLYGDAGNDSIYAQSETNYVDGGEGNDNYFAYIDQTTYVADSAGTDKLTVYSGTGDKYSVVFNVDKDGNVSNDSLKILDATNLVKWANDYALTAQISVKGAYNSIETLELANTNGTDATPYANMTTSGIDAIKEAVAGWLTANNYNDVNAVISRGDSDDVSAMMEAFTTANNTAWQAV